MIRMIRDMSWIVMIWLLEIFIDLCFGRTHKPTQCVSVYFTLHLLYPPQPARPEKRGLLASPQMERLLSPGKFASLQESIWRNYGINLSGMSMHHVHQCTDATFFVPNKRCYHDFWNLHHFDNLKSSIVEGLTSLPWTWRAVALAWLGSVSTTNLGAVMLKARWDTK